MYKRILVANDGSPGAERALLAALALTRQSGAALHMISIEELPRFPASIDEVVEEKDAANHRFSDVIKRAQYLGKEVKIAFHVKVGHAVPTIAEFAKAQGIDLLVLGFMGHSAITTG